MGPTGGGAERPPFEHRDRIEGKAGDEFDDGVQETNLFYPEAAQSMSHVGYRSCGEVMLEGSDLSTSAGSSTAEQAPAEQASSAGRKGHANFVWISG